MLKEYDGRSLADVLQNDVFSGGSDVHNLMTAFATVGVGTGGFSHYYDASFLEVLRVFCGTSPRSSWCRSSTSIPKLFGPHEGGVWGFAMGLARAAVQEAQKFYPQMTFEDMFKLNAVATRITERAGKVITEVEAPAKAEFGDCVIVAMSSGAMQQLQLDLPYPDSPLLPPQHQLIPDLVRPSCLAAMKRLDMVPGYRLTTQLPSPSSYPSWPRDSMGNKVQCFVTDERARLAYALPEVPPLRGVARVTASDTYGSDANKFALMAPTALREAAATSFAYGLQPSGNGGAGAAKPLADLLTKFEVNGVDWGGQPYVQGAFKLDKPGDNYFSSSLFYHYQLARPSNEHGPSDTFLSGDSVGHLGGWVEGAAISAINAVVGVCARMQQKYPDVLTMRPEFPVLLEDDVNLFHRWVGITGGAQRTAGLNSLVRLGNWANDPALPPKWRYDRKTSNQTYEKITLSKPGDFYVAVRADELVFNTRDADGAWGSRRRVPGTGDFASFQSIAVAGEQGSTQVQLMFVDSEGLIWHGICDQTPGGAVWSPFARPWGQMKAQSVALDVEGGNAQVVVKDHSNRLAHGIRLADRSWTVLQFPRSPYPDPLVFYVTDAAASCTSHARNLTTVAAVDQMKGSVYASIRDGRDGGWSAWVELPSPRPPQAEEPFRAVKVRVVVQDDTNNAQIWALFLGDEDEPACLYSSARDTSDPTGSTWTKFEPAPYPLNGVPGRVVDFAPTLPHDSILDPDLPGLSTVIYAQISPTSEDPDVDESDVDEPDEGDLSLS